MYLAGAKNTLEDLKIGRLRRVCMRVRARAGRRLRLCLGAARVAVLILLSNIIENELCCALRDVLEDERYMIEATANIWIKEKHLSPDLC